MLIRVNCFCDHVIVLLKEFKMAGEIGTAGVGSKIELTNVERQYLKLGVAKYLDVLRRSRAKEVTGSDIYHLRTREMDQLTAIASKL